VCVCVCNMGHMTSNMDHCFSVPLTFEKVNTITAMYTLTCTASKYIDSTATTCSDIHTIAMAGNELTLSLPCTH